MSGELNMRSNENEPGFLWNPLFRQSYLRGVLLPRKCRVCDAPMYWVKTFFVCSKKCDNLGISHE